MTEKKVEQVSPEDMQRIRDAKNNTVLATAKAETAVAMSTNAELQANNLILSIYNKYGLVLGTDQIMENGNIVKGATVAPTTGNEDPAPEAPSPETKEEK